MTSFVSKGFDYKSLNTPTWVFSNIWTLGGVSHIKFSVNVSNEKLVNTAKYQIWSSYPSWFIKGNPTEIIRLFITHFMNLFYPVMLLTLYMKLLYAWSFRAVAYRSCNHRKLMYFMILKKFEFMYLCRYWRRVMLTSIKGRTGSNKFGNLNGVGVVRQNDFPLVDINFKWTLCIL